MGPVKDLRLPVKHFALRKDGKRRPVVGSPGPTPPWRSRGPHPAGVEADGGDVGGGLESKTSADTTDEDTRGPLQGWGGEVLVRTTSGETRTCRGRPAAQTQPLADRSWLEKDDKRPEDVSMADDGGGPQSGRRDLWCGRARKWYSGSRVRDTRHGSGILEGVGGPGGLVRGGSGPRRVGERRVGCRA